MLNVANTSSSRLRHARCRRAGLQPPFVIQFLERRQLLSAGQLDSAFGQAGIVSSVPELFSDGVASAVVLQADGRIVAAGSGVANGKTEPVLTRLNTDGSLDATFGTAGQDFLSLGNKASSIQRLVLQSDQKIIAVDDVGDILRIDPDGSLDPTFGVGGIVATPIGANLVAVQTDGDMIAVGTSPGAPGNPSLLTIDRYTSTGTLDATFGTGGEVITSVSSTTVSGDSGATAIALQRNGGIVIGGNMADLDSVNHIFVARFTMAGSLDTHFGAAGIAHVVPRNHGRGATLADLAIQPDGKIVIAGTEVTSTFDADATLVARLTAGGLPDRSFGIAGVFAAALPDAGLAGSVVPAAVSHATGTATALALAPRGKIVVVGYADEGDTGPNPFGPAAQFAAIRVLPSGALDPTFGRRGEIETDGTFGFDTLSAVAIQPDGNILTAGTYMAQSNEAEPPPPVTPSEFVVSRYKTSGTYDRTFGSNGEVGTGSSLFGPNVSIVAAQSDGKILVSNAGLTRLLPDGILDDSFGIDGQAPPYNDIPGNFDLSGVSLLYVLPDGRILSDATTPASVAELVMHNADGSIDRHFGIGGVLRPVRSVDDGPDEIALQPDGKIILVETIGSHEYLARYNANGSPDGRFGKRGKALLSGPANSTLTADDSSVAGSLIIQPDGGIVVSYQSTDPSSSSTNTGFSLQRFLPNGRIDDTFGSQGTFATTFETGIGLGPGPGTGGKLLALSMDAAGGFIAVGLDIHDNVAVAHYTASGAIDPSFGFNGEAGSFTGSFSQVDSAFFAPDGSFILDGAISPSDSFELVRFDSFGVPDASFGSNGIAPDPVGGAMSLAVQSNGDILLAGPGGVARILGG